MLLILKTLLVFANDLDLPGHVLDSLLHGTGKGGIRRVFRVLGLNSFQVFAHSLSTFLLSFKVLLGLGFLGLGLAVCLLVGLHAVQSTLADQVAGPAGHPVIVDNGVHAVSNGRILRVAACRIGQGLHIAKFHTVLADPAQHGRGFTLSQSGYGHGALYSIHISAFLRRTQNHVLRNGDSLFASKLVCQMQPGRDRRPLALRVPGDGEQRRAQGLHLAALACVQGGCEHGHGSGCHVLGGPIQRQAVCQRVCADLAFGGGLGGVAGSDGRQAASGVRCGLRSASRNKRRKTCTQHIPPKVFICLFYGVCVAHGFFIL